MTLLLPRLLNREQCPSLLCLSYSFGRPTSRQCENVVQLIRIRQISLDSHHPVIKAAVIIRFLRQRCAGHDNACLRSAYRPLKQNINIVGDICLEVLFVLQVIVVVIEASSPKLYPRVTHASVSTPSG